MTLFGSSIDASAAVPYTLDLNTASPGRPRPSQSPTGTQGGTKSYPKPTAHLPGDHGAAAGEADKPAFGQEDSAAAPSMSTTPDEGYFQGMSHLLSNSTWLIGAFGAVILFCAGTGLYFWRRQVRRRRAQYTSIAPGEDVPMVVQGGHTASGRRRDGGRTKELYDAFGEVSDDDADEELGLRRPPDSFGPTSLGLHAGFLEDENLQSPTASVPYKDEPDEARQPDCPKFSPRERSSPGSGDDGNWEHTSQQARAE